VEAQPRATALIPVVRLSHGGHKPRRWPIIPIAALLMVLWAGTSFAHKGTHTNLSDGELLRQAEIEFQKGKEAADKPAEARKHFAAAARQFSEIGKRGYSNPALYRNLGNAEMLSGNLAGAVLAYRRGLQLSQNDHALQANLQYARNRVRYPSSSRPPELMWLPSPVLFLLLTLVLYTLVCIAWTRRLIKGHGIWRVVTLGVGVLLAGAAFSFLQWHAWQEERYPLVVIAHDGVPFVRGNGENYPRHAEAPSLNEGVETRRLHERGDWLHIQLPGGEIGWVKRDSVLME